MDEFCTKNYHKNSIQIDQTVFWKIRKSKTVTVLFYFAISARSSNGPWPVHARAHQRTRPSTPRSSRPRLLSQPSCPRPSRARQRTPAPRPQPGPGPGFQPSSIARLGQKRPEPSWPLISDRRCSSLFGRIKTPRPHVSEKP